MKKLLIPIYIVLASIFLLHYLLIGQAVYGDGIYYWSYSRALYTRHSIEISTELNHHYSHIQNNIQEQDSKTSNKLNAYAIYRQPPGASFAWLPFFFLADHLVLLLQLFGIHAAANKYSDIYQIIVGLANVGFVVAGIGILYKLLGKFFPRRIAVLSAILVLSSTPLLYYGSYDVLNSHPFSFLVSVITVYFWFATIELRTDKQWFFLGLLIGILALTRTQDILFLLLPATDIFIFIKKQSAKQKLCIYLKYIMMCSTGFLIGFFPQILFWEYAFHTVYSAYIGKTSLTIFQPHILNFLFDIKTGFLLYSPLFLLSLMSLVICLKFNKRIFTPLLIICLCQIYLLICWNNGLEGETFGPRMLISSTPCFAFGLSLLLKKIDTKIKLKRLLIFGLIITLYTLFKMTNFIIYLHAASYDNGISTKSKLIELIQKNVNTLITLHKNTNRKNLIK